MLAVADLKLKEENEPDVVEESEVDHTEKSLPKQDRPTPNALVRQLMDSRLVYKTVETGLFPNKKKKTEIKPKNRLNPEPRLLKEERELKKHVPSVSLTTHMSATRIRTPSMLNADNSKLKYSYRNSMFPKS